MRPDGREPGASGPALGRFKHEAAAVDPGGRRVYLTEDEPDGGLYRFTPDATPTSPTGRSRCSWRGGGFVAAVPDPSGITAADPRPGAGHHALQRRRGHLVRRRRLLHDQGRQPGLVLRHRAPVRSTVLYDGARRRRSSGVDNVTVTRAGDVYVCEDGGNMEICVITPDRVVAPFLRLTGAARPGPPTAATSWPGVVFDPSGDRMYFSSQRAFGFGVTYEVRGPFARAGAPPPAPAVRAPGPGRHPAPPIRAARASRSPSCAAASRSWSAARAQGARSQRCARTRSGVFPGQRGSVVPTRAR